MKISKMCIIAFHVESVAATKIYVSIDSFAQRQLTIYSNEVKSPSENVMILPVPNPDSVEFVNLTGYKNLFLDLDCCFLRMPMRSVNLYASATRSILGEEPPPRLPVYSVGSYEASIVPSLEEFHRLDTDTFQLPPDLQGLLKKHYASEFGFIVCKLRPGKKVYHPFAYTHAIAENKKLFVPTRHYHPHDGNTDGADWDHEIYSAQTNLDSTREDSLRYKGADEVKWEKFPETYRWASKARLSRWTRKGSWTNDDLWIQMMSS